MLHAARSLHFRDCPFRYDIVPIRSVSIRCVSNPWTLDSRCRIPEINVGYLQTRYPPVAIAGFFHRYMICDKQPPTLNQNTYHAVMGRSPHRYEVPPLI